MSYTSGFPQHLWGGAQGRGSVSTTWVNGLLRAVRGGLVPLPGALGSSGAEQLLCAKLVGHMGR